MDMFTSYGHIKKPKLNHRFSMILAWASPFKLVNKVSVMSHLSHDAHNIIMQFVSSSWRSAVIEDI